MVLHHLSHPPLGGADTDPADPSWTAADVRDVVEIAIEVFGPDRLMLGSDWPVAELGGGYAKVTAGLFTLIGQLHPAGRDAVLGGTARRFYALGPDTTPSPPSPSAWTPDRRAVTPRTS